MITSRHIFLAIAAISAVFNVFAQKDGMNLYTDSLHFPFTLGVCSGDPLPDGVILWTRIESPRESETVYWEISTDSTFTKDVRKGTEITTRSSDYTLKPDVRSLLPGTIYYYRFTDEKGRRSVTGRTKTAPTGSVEHLRFAVASCSSLFSGYFNAYRRISERKDLDLVIHLGDYIYDYPDEDEMFRIPKPFPEEPKSLDTWRGRHKLYLQDPDLRAARGAHPWVVLWDNHDIEALRKKDDKGSVQAFLDYLPIRLPDPGVPQKIFRSLEFGTLLHLLMMDIQQYQRTDTIHLLLGAGQWNYVRSDLRTSKAQWNIIGNQKPMSGWSFFGSKKLRYSSSSWDGYDRERLRWYDFLDSAKIKNVLVLSGDAHVSLAANMVRKPFSPGYIFCRKGCVGAEFLPTSISRGNLDEMGIGGPLAWISAFSSRKANPHHTYTDLTRHGYGILDITHDRIIAEYYYSKLKRKTDKERFGAGLVLKAGRNYWCRYRRFRPVQ
jgi:alkaline phosphatase D